MNVFECILCSQAILRPTEYLNAIFNVKLSFLSQIKDSHNEETTFTIFRSPMLHRILHKGDFIDKILNTSMQCIVKASGKF